MKAKYGNLNSDQWLLQHARDVNSLSGEDGIIEKIFEVCQPANRWCVEFGAWDGKHLSNTCHLMTQSQWSGVFIEASEVRFQDLLKTYAGNNRAHCLQRFVSFEGPNSLDQLLAQSPIPRDFDLLSIDIDGADYHIWDSLREYQPRVVIIEFNHTIPSHVEFVQPRNLSLRQGNSILSLVKLGKTKGYELICVTEYNAIFVRTPLFPSFHIANNEVSRLRPPTEEQFHIFQLYDGTFVIGGSPLMPWQSVPIRQDKFQVIPKFFRRYPIEDMSRPWKLARMIWRFLYVRGIL